MKKLYTILWLVAGLTIAGCKSLQIGESFPRPWDHDGSHYMVQSNESTASMGDISSITLRFTPHEGSTPSNEPPIWQISAQTRIKTAGFHFEVFKVPPGFRLVKGASRVLRQDGDYWLSLKAAHGQMTDLINSKDVITWNEQHSDNQ
jgi:hypothetical protein